MPLARIDLPAGKPPEYGRAVADTVYDAMIATLNAPKGDRFQPFDLRSHQSALAAHRLDELWQANYSRLPTGSKNEFGRLFHQAYDLVGL